MASSRASCGGVPMGSLAYELLLPRGHSVITRSQNSSVTDLHSAGQDQAYEAPDDTVHNQGWTPKRRQSSCFEKRHVVSDPAVRY